MLSACAFVCMLVCVWPVNEGSVMDVPKDDAMYHHALYIQMHVCVSM